MKTVRVTRVKPPDHKVLFISLSLVATVGAVVGSLVWALRYYGAGEPFQSLVPPGFASRYLIASMVAALLGILAYRVVRKVKRRVEIDYAIGYSVFHFFGTWVGCTYVIMKYGGLGC